MDVDRQTNLPEEQMSQRRSLSSNYRHCSQSRKVSIGVPVDSISKTETKDPKRPVMQAGGNEASSKGNCVKDCEGHTPLVEKHVTVEQKDTSPWVSTRSFSRKISSSVAVQDTEHTPSFPPISRRRPRSKLLDKASAAHSLKFFAARTALESDDCRKKNSSSVEAGKDNNENNDGVHVDNHACPTEPGVRLEKERVEDKDGTAEIGGRETLRIKLWEILGTVSSPNKHCPSPKHGELHPDQERESKQSPIGKINQNSDTIESDSQPPVFTRPMTRSSTRRKASTRKQSNKTEATESIHRKECPQKRLSSPGGNWSGRLYDKFNNDSLTYKRNKTLRTSSRVETCQGRKCENAEERMQSEKSRSIPAVENSMGHKSKASNASSSSHRINVFLELKKGTKNNTSEPPLDMTTDQKDFQLPKEVEVPKKNQQEDIHNSPCKKKRNSGNDPLDSLSESKSHGRLPKKQEDIHNSPCKKKRNSRNDPLDSLSESKSRGCLPKNKHTKPQDQSPAENIFNATDIRSFKSLINSKSAECNPNVQLEPSDGRCRPNDSPRNSFLMKSSAPLDEDGENKMSKSSTVETDSESSEDESHKKGCGEPEELSPELFISQNLLNSQNRSLGSGKDVNVAGCSPASDSLKASPFDKGTGCSPESGSEKGNQDNGETEMYLEQNHEDGLASAVALFAVALNRLKTKLKSISSKRSAEILRAAVEEIFSRLQSAESQIKTDMGKLTSLSHLKRKQLETRFQEQQDQLLGIYKRFKEDVDQHLHDYGSVIEDLEEHEIEFKRSVEKQRAAHKKVLAQVEQEINVQLDVAESRITAVQELAREKMLQLKLGVAECFKHGAIG